MWSIICQPKDQGDLGIQNIAGIMGIRNKTKTQKTTLSDTIGQRPGALIHVGEQKVDQVTVNLIEYDSEKINEITNDIKRYMMVY